ncbi:MAG: helix-turn-helix transcriptional regulator, partial [Lachnospiraceae bacterium]|nr:helix-turn-helix transcriptional regulator [Lachnospiraceae bacterium]
MGDKSIQKKQYIIDVAAKVFSEMGYKNVTMKDVVDACDISRGVLYLYYESTSELFIDVLKSQAAEGEDFTSLI